MASYGAKDRTLKDAAERLEGILTAAGIDHDVKEYPEADHAFMNDHSADKAPFLIHVISFVFGGGGFDPAAAQDSRRRITAFFDRHLKARDSVG